MGNTFRSDVEEYQNRQSGNLKPSPTRALVVDTRDPLFAGRVKIWIPALHGPNPYGESGLEDVEQESLPPGVKIPGNFKDEGVKAGLPWAKVLSGNLGSFVDFKTGISTPAGIFSTPRVGTEVIIIFENNDPHWPIIIGSIIHANEFRYSMPRPMEYLPGIQLSEIKQLSLDDDPAATKIVGAGGEDEYPSVVSSVYNLRTARGSTLFLSDIETDRSIVLEGSIAFDETSTLLPEEESTLKRLYPPFPTTASAAFAKRQALSSGNTSPMVPPSPAASTVNPNNSAVVRDINVQSVNSSVIEESKTKQAASDKVEKCWPVSGAPRFITGLGKFGAQRPPSLGGKVHTGIDIGANADGSTILLAPIDLYPMYSGYIKNAGYMLLCLGVDGYAHSFLHEREIYKKFYDMGQPGGKVELVKRGTPLGICGITEITNHNTGPHLHWEVFDGGDAHTGTALAIRREALRKSISTMIDPLEWMKFSNGTQISVVTTTKEQAQRYFEYSAISTQSSESEYSKPAGIEVSLTPGKETVVLRHPSGSYIGFDPDGNINIYSCGDINFRVNRSITYDVFGAIMENAFAKFSRIKTVLKSWSRINTNLKDPKTANDTMPEFYTRVENTRNIDMANAVASNLGNSLILDSNNTLVDLEALGINSTENGPGDLYITSPVITPKSFNLTTWDTILKKMYAKYIVPNPTAKRVFPEITDFKALMLHESNGDEKAKSPAQAYGLFQLRGIAIKDVKGYYPTSAEMTQFLTGEINADIAFQYIVKLVEYIRKALDSANINPNDVSATDYRYLVVISYNQGPTITAKAIRKARESGQTLTYKAVENVGIVAKMFTSEALQYVPTIQYIKDNTPTLV